MTPDERYIRDPLFRTMVDQMEFFIREAKMTGTEIREAAILAAIHYENTLLRSYVVYRDEQSQTVVEDRERRV